MNEIATANYQQIARAAIGKASSFQDVDCYIELTKHTCKAFTELNTNEQLAIEAAYVFSRKVPENERQDLFQELLLAVLESGTENPAFAYTIARRDWQNWYASYKLHSQFHGGSLNESILNSEGEEDTELIELIVGEAEFEAKLISDLDARAMWKTIPANIQKLLTKRMLGKPLGSPRKRGKGQPKSSGTLDNTERSQLSRWIKRDGFKLLLN